MTAAETAIARGRAEAAADTRAQTALALAALTLLTVMLRLVPVLFAPSLDWPDEIFQAAEPAHRLVYGTGLIPWEFQLGVRSWLLPGAVAAIMEAARLLGDGPAFYLPAIAVAFALLAAAPVLCCFLWCRERFGLAASLAGAAVVATAPDLVYLGARTLSEVVAAHLMVLALFALERRRTMTGGILLALATVLRVQLGPALALVALWHLARRRGGDAGALLLGGGAVMLLASLLDWATLGAPLASVWRYVIVNIRDGVADANGIRPWDFYAAWEFALWHGALGVPLLLAALGARRMALPLAAASVILLTHSLIGHKEYRFVYPAILLVAIAAGFGLAALVDWAERAVPRHRPLCAPVATACWALVAFMVWIAPGFAVLRNLAHDTLAATASAARDPEMCGVGLAFGLDGGDWIYGSYTRLHRPVPRYWPGDAAEMAAQSPGFNRLIGTKPPPAGLGYAVQECFGDVCVARRPGGCAPVPMQALPLPAPLR